MPEQASESNLLSYFIDFFLQDWFASVPISICLVAMVAVIAERHIYYSRNQRDLKSFIRRVQGELEKNNLDGAMALAKQVGGLIGLITEEGLRLIKFHARNFTNAFDISANLYVRDLERRLSVLATIGATCPFLGLFGTVVGVIVTLKLLGEQGGQSAAVVLGVAKALIATGYGLIVAIVAVVMYNYFNSVVRHFESDFEFIKLTLIDYAQSQRETTGGQVSGAKSWNHAASGGANQPAPGSPYGPNYPPAQVGRPNPVGGSTGYGQMPQPRLPYQDVHYPDTPS